MIVVPLCRYRDAKIKSSNDNEESFLGYKQQKGIVVREMLADALEWKRKRDAE